MIDFQNLKRESNLQLQKFLKISSKPSLKGKYQCLLPGEWQHIQLGRENKSDASDGFTPCGFMSMKIDGFNCDEPILLDRKNGFSKLTEMKISTRSIKRFQALKNEVFLHWEEEDGFKGKIAIERFDDEESIRIYKLMNKTPPKNFKKVLSFNLFEDDMKNLKSYLTKKVQKFQHLNLLYFQEDDFKEKNEFYFQADLNWIFGRRGRVLFSKDKIYAHKESPVPIHKGRNIKVHQKQFLPLVAEFTPDLFIDVNDTNYECSFYTDGPRNDTDYGKWYLRMDSRKNEVYHFFSNPVQDDAAWIGERQESE